MKGPNWWGGLFGRTPKTPPAPERLEAEDRQFERVLGYSFARAELLVVALTHPSAASGTDAHYERLEFLGDAVLDLAVADLLMRKFPGAKEGPLSKQRASIVNARTLALKAQTIGIAEMLRLGRGEEKSGGRDKVSILAAAFEAVIGAIYTDGGLSPAQEAVERLFEADIGGPTAERDYKTELQEIAYRQFHAQPVYEVIGTVGPDHAKRFTTRILIGARAFGTGEGGSKKQSEQAAAREALEKIEQERGGSGN
ncbi:MAG: ribonuclease III [Candidatus Binataceae bacterium]